MKLTESIRMSWRAITGHKLRSTLTTLGIIIGIAAVITFMVLGGGLEQDVLGDIETEEDPTMQVVTQPESGGLSSGQQVSTPIYTASDVAAVSNISGVESVTPTASLSAVQLTHGEETITGGSGSIYGVSATNPDRFDAELYNVTAGETFNSQDEAVINERMVDLKEEVGGENLTVGDEITITLQDDRELNLTVSGVVEQNTGGGQPRVFVPLEYYDTTVETPSGTEERAYPALLVRAESVDQLESVQEDVDDYFQNESVAKELKNEGYTIEVQTIEDAIDQFTSFLDQLQLFIGGVAGLSLFVGSIGIANIMIVSVTERTREIGIMKAVGAKKREVIQLFLVESLILGTIGAILGVLLGLGVGYLAVSIPSWPMVVPYGWIGIAVFVGVLVGVLAGLYPAWRGARVDPIEALRRE
jgi:putative ABC transport system permease protein